MTVAIVDRRISPACERGLLKRGFRVVKLPPMKQLSEPLSSHPDMLMLLHGGELVTSCAYAEEADYILSDLSLLLDGVKMTFTSQAPCAPYPNDCIFNALVMGEYMIAKTDTVARELISLSERQGLKLVHTQQGYPACTVLPLGDGAAITADRGMAKVLTECGIDVTLIENGDIALPPYEYGFIGGAAGTLGNTVYFLGDPARHRDFERIAAAIERAGMCYAALSDEPLSDLGRIVFWDSNVD